MKNKIAMLFDLDGVIIDTEPQYDIFWKKTAKDYQLGISNFERIIKGIVLPDIITRYFSHLSEIEQEEIKSAVHTFELQMDIVPIPGVLAFLDKLKNAGIKIGLVTSSDNAKLAMVFNQLPIRHYFASLVTSDRVTRGKPDPMCYLLAAEDLCILPSDCYVFEDSFNGIAAGTAAGMKVIGIATTHPPESLHDKVLKVIPDFNEISLLNFL